MSLADEAIVGRIYRAVKTLSCRGDTPHSYFGRAAEGYQGVLWQSEQLTLENVELALLGPELLAGTAHAFGRAKSAARAVSPGSHS